MHGLQSVAQFPLLVLALFAFSACSLEIEEPNRTRRQIVPAIYDSAKCRVPKTQGEHALLAKLNSDQITISDYFGKRYDRADLDAVLGASALSTAHYISNLLGGRLFRVPRAYREGEIVCPMFTDLPLLPVELEPTWYSQVDGLTNPAERLAGLYFEACIDDCRDHEVVLPTILIDDGMDRWTLVHEMMHHNFNKERKRDPGSINERDLARKARDAKEEVVRLYEHYRSTSNPDSLVKMSGELNWLVRVFFYESLIRSNFEEIAIEGQLVDEFAAGRLKNVDRDSASNALWYMRNSRDKGISIFSDSTFKMRSFGEQKSAMDLLDFVEIEARSLGRSHLYHDARESKIFITRLKDKSERLINRAEDHLSSMGFNIFEEGTPIFVPSLRHGHVHESHVDHLPSSDLLEEWKKL